MSTIDVMLKFVHHFDSYQSFGFDRKDILVLISVTYVTVTKVLFPDLKITVIPNSKLLVSKLKRRIFKRQNKNINYLKGFFHLLHYFKTLLESTSVFNKKSPFYQTDIRLIVIVLKTEKVGYCSGKILFQM